MSERDKPGLERLEQRLVLSATAPSLVASWSDEVSLFGDYNLDGSVDAADYTVWRDAFGSAETPGEGADGSGDGTVNEQDHSFWASYYGAETADMRVELSWEAVSGATSYNVKRSEAAGGPYSTVATGVTGTRYSDATPGDGRYYYTVAAVDDSGEGPPSNEATPPQMLQAEDATLSGALTLDDDAGFLGDGYVTYASASGGYIEWSVAAAQAGQHQLAFRYALDSTASRPLALTVNGESINPSVMFATTGDSSAWKDLTATASLAAGDNTIRLTTTGVGGGAIDQLTVTQLAHDTPDESNLRRPVSPDQPMWLVHIDTWNYADPQKIIDLIPEDIRPYVVMNISLSISHDVETSQFQVAEYGYEIAKSWLRVCAENQMWAVIQHSSGGFAQFSDFDLSVYEEFYRDYPNLIGFSYAEQFWGFDEANDPLSSQWSDRIDHFANLLELSHQYGGYLIVSWCGNQWNENINPIGMLKRNPGFAQASREYAENYILFEKYTQQSYQLDMESVTLGAYLSGYAGNYGIRYDDTGWTDANGEHENFTLVTGAAPQLEHAMLTGQTVVDGPELIWLQNFRETNRVPAGDGYTQRNWDTYPQFKNVSFDLFRKVLDGTARIPTREEVIERTEVVIVNDVNFGGSSDVYASPETLFEGLYALDGNYEDNKSFFKSTGRYPTIPTVFDLGDGLAQSFATPVARSDYDTRWPTIAAKQAELNALFPEEYTGDLYAGRHENGWVVYNPFKTGQTASASIPFQYNTSERLELTFSQYTTGIVKEYADRLDIYLNNYDNVIDTGLKTDTIRVYGSTSEPTWSFADRGDHQASVVTSDWTDGVLTLTVRHNGALDLTINASGAATDRLRAYTPASIVTPVASMVYTGPLQHEVEVFDYKSVSGVTTAGQYGSVRNYTGQGYLNFGASPSAAVRDTFDVLKDGVYRLETRYSVTGNDVNTVDVYVNGVFAGTPSFAQTTSNSDWAISAVDVALVEGVNTIELRARSAAPASLYLDNIVVDPTSYGDGLVIQEGEPGFAGLDGTIDVGQPGYTGTGYANSQDTAGAGVDWSLDFDTSKVKSFTFRYAGTSDRTADLVVNGVTVASDIDFTSTGSLSAWGHVTVYASVPAGVSAVRLEATGATGLPNLDSLEVFGANTWNEGSAPFMPVGLVATSDTASQVDLDWWVAPGADSYNVLRATSSSGPYVTIATGLTDTEFSDVGLAELETYHYVVTAVNAWGQSEASTEVSATTETTQPPAAPTGLTAVGDAFDRVLLSWQASPGADSYTVRRSLSSGGPYTTVALGVTGTEFADSDMFAATEYHYVVAAVNQVGEGASSPVVSASTLSTAVLTPIADAYVRDGGSVNSNFGGDTTLVVKNDGGGGFTRNTLLRFDVDGLAEAESVQLTLTPFQVDSGDAMAYEVVADDTWNEETVTWNNQPAGTGIRIATASGFVPGQPRTVDITDAVTGEAAGDGILSLLLSMPNIGNNYVGFYSREHVNASQRPTLVATLPYVAHPAPSSPTGLAATPAGPTEIDLSWAAPAAARRYNISRAAVSGGPYELVAAGVEGLQYRDSGLQEGETYHYVVTAFNGTGESAPSLEASATTTIAPAEYQAEDATLAGAVVGDEWEGYDGTGYADFVNASGDYTEWTITVPQDGEYTLEFRYANGSGADRPLRLTVNGSIIQSGLAFPPTGAWSNYSSSAYDAALVAGVNTVRLTAIGSSGGNLDSLSVTPSEGGVVRIVAGAVETALVEAEAAASITAPRGRPVLSEEGVTFVADNGSLLRGPFASTEWGAPPPLSNVQAIKEYGANAIHLYGEVFDPSYQSGVPGSGTAPGYAVNRIDQMVEMTRDEGLYLVLTIGNGGNNGSFNYDYVIDFWTLYADRYKDETHVIFEVQNEPHAWSTPYPDAALEMQADAYTLIRSLAPDTPILLFSIAVLGDGGSAVADINEVSQAASIDWSNTGVAFHGYAGMATIPAVETIINAGYPVFMTEVAGSEWGTRAHGLVVEQTAEYERLGISWLTFQHIPPNSISSSIFESETYSDLIERAGISWAPDFGSFPAQRGVYGNGGLPRETPDLSGVVRVQAEHFDTGSEGVAYSDADPVNSGGQLRLDTGVDLEVTTDAGGGHNVTAMADGEWLEYTINVTEPGYHILRLRVASPSGGTARVLLHDDDKTGAWGMPATGGSQVWTTVEKEVFLEPGRQKIRLEVVAGEFNLNWIELSPATAGAIPNGVYKILNRNSGLALARGQAEGDDVVVQADYTGSSNQQWRLVHRGAGHYSIVNAAANNWSWSNTYAPVFSQQGADPLGLIPWGYDTASARRFVLSPQDNGFFSIIVVDEGYSVGMVGGSTEAGDFAQFREPTGGGEQQWAIVTPSTPAFPTGPAAVWDADANSHGDYNGDGLINAADYTMWRDNLGSQPAPGQGTDGTGDGVVDQQDYDFWAARYGMDTPSQRVEFSWEPVAGATGYNVKRTTSPGGPYTTIASNVTGTQFSDPTPQAGDYYYVVTAIGVGGESLPSAEAFAKGPRLFSESGGVVSMEAENGSLGGRWFSAASATASGEAYIEVDPAYNNTQFGPEGESEEHVVRYDFSTSTAGNYRFWFRLLSNSAEDDSFFWRIDGAGWNLENNRSGVGAWFSTDNSQVNSLAPGEHVLEIAYRENGTRLDKFVLQLDSLPAPSGSGPAESVPPAPPTGLLASVASNTRIDLTWSPSAAATSYVIKRSEVTGGPYTVVASGLTAAGYSDEGLLAGTTYYYVVCSVNAFGESLPSGEAFAATDTGGVRSFATLLANDESGTSVAPLLLATPPESDRPSARVGAPQGLSASLFTPMPATSSRENPSPLVVGASPVESTNHRDLALMTLLMADTKGPDDRGPADVRDTLAPIESDRATSTDWLDSLASDLAANRHPTSLGPTSPLPPFRHSVARSRN